MDQQRHTTAQDRIKQLERENSELRKSLNQAEDLVRVKDHALIALNLSGKILRWNAGASALLGYADDELLGRSGDILFLPEDRDRGLFLEELRWAIEEGYAQNERWQIKRDGSRFWASGSTTPMLDGDGRPRGFLSVFRDSTAVRTEAEHRELLLAEMGHRVKNAFSTMQAVVLHTLRRGGVSTETQVILDARLNALALSHELLTRNQWHGAALTEVVERALLPYGDGERGNLKGPLVWLPARAAEMLGLAFHELATNAAKYGALSVADGQVDVSWNLNIAGSGTRLLHLVWRERGGPPATSPTHQGFGLRLLEQGIVQDLDGTLKLAFHPEGLECHLCLPVAPAEQTLETGNIYR
ncbi:HWE histidine kinase domain-containing protein [Roseomonas haemaphysalidis]|uniref:HWE histidine kinase domain-containing protein n=1 Tax=Roseomonas haemaphysalidis TaxID=2768162 RepID=UPI001F2CC905|nr:HWE histidine kinase domain-containing protein [Roseomonas haemaphysalidis]